MACDNGGYRGTGPEPPDAARMVFTQARRGSPNVVVVPHTPQPSMADFRMAWFRAHISRVFPHVEAMMVIMQTGSFSSVAARVITDSYIGRTAEMKLL